MKLIPGFSAQWLEHPIDILDNEQGIIQMKLTAPISKSQQQQTIKYLIAEGFITTPEIPPDDYKLPEDFGTDFTTEQVKDSFSSITVRHFFLFYNRTKGSTGL